MKPLADLDHYEVLEIPRGTPREAIERAYQLAMATYADDSLAGYSVFDAGDAAVMRERIETAYRVLSDSAARGAYDAALSRAAPVEAQLPFEPSSPTTASEPDRAPEPTGGLAPLEAFEEDSDHYDGARLRRSRLRRGLELEGVAQVTKVNPTYLHFIEEERYEDLPARVYVRGFLMAYASCVGLDPAAVAASYLERFDAARAGPKRHSRGA